MTSIADILGARYGRSRAVAVIATLIAVVGAMPYIALQLQAVSFSFEPLSGKVGAGEIAGAGTLHVPIWQDTALIVTLLMAAFTILFGVRHVEASEQHRGMMLAIAIALAEFIWDAWRPYYAILGRADGVKGYHDITRYPQARRIPGLVIFRWDAPLFFANAEFFREMVLDAIHASPTPVQWIVVAAEPVTSIDILRATTSSLSSSRGTSALEVRFRQRSCRIPRRKASSSWTGVRTAS